MAEKTENTKSTATLDLEARLDAEKGNVESADAGRSFAVKGNDLSAYVGVDPEYQTYADETHKPFRAAKGAEKVFEGRVLTAMAERDENGSTVGIHGYNVETGLDSLAAQDGEQATASDSKTSQATGDDEAAKAAAEEEAKKAAEQSGAPKN